MAGLWEPMEQVAVLFCPGDLSHQKSWAAGTLGSGVSLAKLARALAELATQLEVLVAYCMLQKLAASPKLSRKATSSPALAGMPEGLLIPWLSALKQPMSVKALLETVNERNLALGLNVQLNQLLTTFRAFEVRYTLLMPEAGKLTNPKGRTSLRRISE
jgi:hypothetical protein